MVPWTTGDRDALFEEAAHIVVQHQQGSASLLQRRLKLGYNRAGRIVDQLEAAGIIGPFEGSKARQVLIQDILSLEQKLQGNG
jgi:S-DNA-T family DNA segregation ATPase FtsK/SpoIIIE